MLQLFDKMKAAALEGKTLPLKGKVKVILIDPRDGTECIAAENHNLVTDAISSIFSTNWLNAVDFYNLLPTWYQFGGIFCFSENLPADVSTVWPKNENLVRMTANAGQTAHSSASPTRGNPNGQATEISGNHITLAWDWSISQGNGSIKCCCLTNSLAGDCGLLPDGTQSLWKPTTPRIAGLNAINGSIYEATYSRNLAITMPVAVDSSGNGISLYFNGTTLEEITTAHSFVTANLLEPAGVNDIANYRELSTRTATLSRTFAVNYTQLAQDSSNYYVIERDSQDNKTLYVDVISKTDMSVSNKTIEITDASITLARSYVQLAKMYSGIVSNGSVYIVSGSDAKKFVRVNINNSADVEELSSNMAENINLGQSALVLNDNLIMGYNFLINGDTVYPLAGRQKRSGDSANYHFMDVLARSGNGPLIYQRGCIDSDSYVYVSAGGMLALPYLATVANITEVNKTASKAMRIEYQLTQA